MVINESPVPCYDYRIMSEYWAVLKRPKLGFWAADINALLDSIESNGHSIVVDPLDDEFVDEKDKKDL